MEHPVDTPGTGGFEEHSRGFLMNACLVCNVVFVTQNRCSLAEGLSRFQVLCEILQVPLPSKEEVVPETNMLCNKCNKAIDEYLKLKKQIQGLIRMMEELRRILGKKILDTYAITNKNRKNYVFKVKFFEVWYPKINASTEPINLEQTFSSILESLNSALDPTPKPNRTIAQSNASAQHYNNSMNLSSTIASIQNVEHDANEDNYSTCPSPASPAFVEDYGDDGPDSDNIIVTENNVTQERSLLGVGEMESSYQAETGTYQNSIVDTFALPSSTTSTYPVTNNAFHPTDSSSTIAAAAASSENVEPTNSTSVTDQLTDKRRSRPILKTNRRTHPCKFCGKLFPTYFSLQMHERIHTGEKPFACSICGRPFNNKAAMVKHTLTHDPSRYEGEPQFTCDICGKRYHLEKTLYMHKRDHITGGDRWKRKKPRDPNAPPIKKKKKVKKKKERDPNAPPKPPKKSVLKKEKSEGDRPRRVKRKKELKLDEDGNPIPTERKPRRLKKPPKPESDKPKRIIKHRYAPFLPRGAPRIPAICSYCGKDCVTHHRLAQHVYTHTGEKPLQCSICGRNFAMPGNLQKHMKTHDPNRLTGEPKHVCEHCGKAFHRPGTLYHHRREKHLGFGNVYKHWRNTYRRKRRKENAHKGRECKICGAKVNSESMFDYHMKHKHGEKKHKCDICERPFFDAKEVRTHKKSHEPTFLYNRYFRYQCPACPPEFLGHPNKDVVRSHWREAHAGQTLPDVFKKPKNIAGSYSCDKCEEVDGKIPTYKYLRSLDKHNNLYHSENAKLKGRIWKPLIRKEGDRDSTKRRDKDEMSMSDDESESEMEYDSDAMPKQRAKEPISKSDRKTRGKVLNLSKLLKDSEDESDDDTVGKLMRTKRYSRMVSSKGKSKPTTLSNTRRFSSKTNLTDEYIRQKLGGRELHLVLTRIDEAPTSKEIVKVCSSSAIKNICNEIHEDPISNEESASLLSEEETDDALASLHGDPLAEDPLSSKMSVVPEAISESHGNSLNEAEEAPEIKEETEDSDGDSDASEGYTEPRTSTRMFTSLPTNVPIIIHNPLSTCKSKAPIIIPATTTSTSVSKPSKAD